MSAIALLVEPGELVGFLLLGNPAAIASAPSDSDCIFTGVPSDPSLLSHPLGAFVQEVKNSEFHCMIEESTEGVIVKVTPTTGISVELNFSTGGSGQWVVTTENGRHSGFCEFAKKQNG